jgi:cellobiose phosphorylase
MLAGAMDDAALDNMAAECGDALRAGRAPVDGTSPEDARRLLERYWRFEDARDADGMISGGRVVVRSLVTPRPVLHMMACGHARLRDQWGSFWDQHCGGFCCVDSVLAGKMSSHLDTNYVPTSPQPQDVRNFYVHQAGRAWSMFPVAGHEEGLYEDFECCLGLDTFSLSATRGSLACRLDVFVHAEWPLEVWRVRLANLGDERRRLSWFARIRVNVDSYPFYYFVPRVVCEGVRERGALVFLNHDRNNAHPRAAFLASCEPMDGLDMMEEVFEGAPARAPVPAAVRRGRCFDSLGLQPHAGLNAAAQYDAELPAGASRTWTLAYGRCPVELAAREAFLNRVRDEVLTSPDECRREVERAWAGKIAASRIATGDDGLDRYYNVWCKYQLRNQSRFVRALDKAGYRDVLQDLLGACQFEPAYTRARLLEALRYQFADGRAVRQYGLFPGGGHDTRLYQDSASWIPDVLCEYVSQTGDWDLLDEPVAFLDEKTLEPDESSAASVYEHAARAVRSLFANTGYHGLCAIGYGDWNDALSGIGGEKGASVWLSCACVHAAGAMSRLAAHLARSADADEFASIAAEMTARVNRSAWDGRWYVYAYDREGRAIGSHACDEGKIHLNVNTWALFTGVAGAGGREDAVWEALRQLATPVGHRLLAPSYTAASRDRVGRIADCMPGMFENGSIYTHGEAFYLYALASRGRSDEWLDEIAMTLPSRQVPDISTSPPHQQSNFFVGPDHPRFGENLFSGFTGSVTWYKRGIETIVGILPEPAGLRVRPRPPRAWDRYRAARTFRGAKLEVRFVRTGRTRVTVNGADVGELIPAGMFDSGRSYSVEVEYA